MRTKQEKGFLSPRIGSSSEGNYMDNSTVTIANALARAAVQWNALEFKLFYSVVSKISTRDENFWVTLPKQDLIEKLGKDVRRVAELRGLFDKLLSHSGVRFTGRDKNEWEDGHLIRKVRSNRKDISVQFEESYLPLIEGLRRVFTTFKLDSLLCLKNKYAIQLYLNLLSWANRTKYINFEIDLYLKDLREIFDLHDGQFCRDTGKDTEHFDWYTFEKRVLIPAINEINENSKVCEMYIQDWAKITSGTLLRESLKKQIDEEHFDKTEKEKALILDEEYEKERQFHYTRPVKGYRIYYAFVDKDGYYVI